MAVIGGIAGLSYGHNPTLAPEVPKPLEGKAQHLKQEASLSVLKSANPGCDVFGFSVLVLLLLGLVSFSL